MTNDNYREEIGDVINPLVVSFDFDGTLTRKSIQNYVKCLIAYGIEVHVVTSRRIGTGRQVYVPYSLDGPCISYDNAEMYAVTDKLGISRKHIHYMGQSNYRITKSEFFSKASQVGMGKDFLFHVDNCPLEIADLKRTYDETHTTIPISCYKSAPWKVKCWTIIRQHADNKCILLTTL